MKTLQKEVIELLMNRIGVDDGCDFMANYNMSRQKYKFLRWELFTLTEHGWVVPKDMWDILFAFIVEFEKCDFATQAFKPKDNEKYWYVTPHGYTKAAYFSSSGTMDCLNVACGNCFRTKAMAEVNRHKILEILKGENDE